MIKRFEIKKGQKDWRPKEWPRILCDFKRIYIECVPLPSMAFDYGSDKDGLDWKKVAGVVLGTPLYFWNYFLKSRDNIQMAWRWNEKIARFEFCLYVNEKGKDLKFEKAHQLLRILPEEAAYMMIEKVSRREYRVFLYGDGQIPKDVNPFYVKTRRAWFVYMLSGAWYGGKNNSPGDYGGRAPKDMEMMKSIEVVK